MDDDTEDYIVVEGSHWGFIAKAAETWQTPLLSGLVEQD